jgi:ComEC/Rec2-related protein
MICGMPKSTKNIFFSWFFILGVITLSLGWLNLAAVSFGLLIFIVILAIIFYRWPDEIANLIPWFFLFFIVGIFSLGWQERSLMSNQFKLGRQIKYQGIVQEIRPQLDYQRLTVSTAAGLIWVSTKTWPIFWPGDQVAWQCAVQPVDLKAQLQHQIQVRCWSDQLRLEKATWSVKRFFAKQKNYLNNLLSRRVPKPESDLAAGLLWGERAFLPKELTIAFQRVGLSHIVAVSGYNFTIILLVLSQLLIRLGLNKKTGWPLLLIFISGFIIFTGASGSVWRAGLMSGLTVVAYALGRKLAFFTLISLATVFLAAVTPALLVFDIGFQLSVAATLGLVYAAGPLEKILAAVPVLIRSTLATTLAAILSTAPLILCYFGNFSIIALLANILVLPLIAWNMSWALLVLVLGWLPGLGVVVGYLTTLSFRGLIKIVEQLSGWSMASISLAPSLVWLGLYVFIIPLICYLYKKYG